MKQILLTIFSILVSLVMSSQAQASSDVEIEKCTQEILSRFNAEISRKATKFAHAQFEADWGDTEDQRNEAAIIAMQMGREFSADLIDRRFKDLISLIDNSCK